jgi:F-type H+-transporting ATPase subunit beta
MVETTNKGYVCQIIGPVLDIEFPSGNLPPIYSALKIETADGIGNIVEVQQLLGDNTTCSFNALNRWFKTWC